MNKISDRIMPSSKWRHRGYYVSMNGVLLLIKLVALLLKLSVSSYIKTTIDNIWHSSQNRFNLERMTFISESNINALFILIIFLSSFFRLQRKSEERWGNANMQIAGKQYLWDWM